MSSWKKIERDNLPKVEVLARDRHGFIIYGNVAVVPGDTFVTCIAHEFDVTHVTHYFDPAELGEPE